METQPEQMRRCKQCEAHSSYSAAFVEKKSWKRGSHYLCFTCNAYENRFGSFYKSTVMGSVYIYAFFLWSTDGAWLESLQRLLILYSFAYVSIFLHELGHALAARVVGLTMLTFSVGGGGREKVLRCGPYFMFFRFLPTEGQIVIIPPTVQHYRKKMAIVLLAGPLFNFLIAIVTIVLSLSLPATWGSFLFLFIGINLAMGALNLWPFRRAGEHGRVLESDGAQLLGLRSVDDEKISQLVNDGPWIQAYFEYQWGSKNRALELVQNLNVENAANEQKVAFSAFLMECGDESKVVAFCRKTLSEPGLEPQNRSILENNLAAALLKISDSEYSSEADIFSSSAMTVLPMQLEVRLTRASLLVAKKEYYQALELLDDRRFVLLSTSTRASAKALKSIACMGTGKPDLAKASLLEAQNLEPSNSDIADVLKRFPQLSSQ